MAYQHVADPVHRATQPRRIATLLSRSSTYRRTTLASSRRTRPPRLLAGRQIVATQSRQYRGPRAAQPLTDLGGSQSFLHIKVSQHLPGNRLGQSGRPREWVQRNLEAAQKSATHCGERPSRSATSATVRPSPEYRSIGAAAAPDRALYDGLPGSGADDPPPCLRSPPNARPPPGYSAADRRTNSGAPARRRRSATAPDDPPKSVWGDRIGPSAWRSPPASSRTGRRSPSS